VGTAVSAEQLGQVLDNLDVIYYGDTTRSTDAIFTQCADDYSSGQQMQLRLEGVYGQLNLTDCSNPVIPPVAFSADACTEQAFNQTTGNGTNLTRLNIVFVPSISGAIAFHHRGEHYNSNREYWIALEAGSITSARFPRLLAHELTHWLWPSAGGAIHVTTGCDGTNNANIMCGTWAGQGRRLTTAQCSDIYNNAPPYYYDWN